jgi:hypothetical protein
MYDIEDGVPISKKIGNGRPSKYPFRQMLVGQSCFIPDKTPKSLNSLFPKTDGIKFTMRTVTENGIKGVRVWRIE